jgi:hypothetical protein
MPARRLKRKPKPYVAFVDIVGNHTCEHGVPTNVRGEKPAFCIQCTRAVRAVGHGIFRSVKPEPFDWVMARQKQEDDEAERRKTFAQRMHGKRKKAILAALTPEEMADLKQRELAIKASRRAAKFRRKRGLKNKPRSN